jgi:hypothetical protein
MFLLDLVGILCLCSQLLHPDDLVARSEVDVSVLARGTPGFSGAELENMVNQVSLSHSWTMVISSDACYAVRLLSTPHGKANHPFP